MFNKKIAITLALVMLMAFAAVEVFAATPPLGIESVLQGGSPTPDPIELARIPVENNDDWILWVDDFDGFKMALVPAGCFEMGTEDGDSDEEPVFTYCFDEPFWIDVYEVSNDQYGSMPTRDFCINISPGEDTPRVCISALDAQDFCEDRGGRLPTEAEWEYASRGPDNLIYPWGNEYVLDYVIEEDTPIYGEREAAPVGSLPRGMSWVGAMDMAGNVWEWTSSSDAPYPYDPTDGRENGTGSRILRGGSMHVPADGMYAARRLSLSASSTVIDVGFRCVRDVDSSLNTPSATPFATEFVTPTQFFPTQAATLPPSLTPTSTPSNTPSPDLTAFPTQVSNESAGNLRDVADANDLLFVGQAFDLAGVGATLSETGPYTLFAPTDEAFNVVLSDLLILANDPQTLVSTVQYHMVEGALTGADLVILAQEGETLTTLAGESLSLEMVGGAVVINGTATLIEADLNASNGVIHVIDAVLFLPEANSNEGGESSAAPNTTMIELINGRSDLSTLFAALSAAPPSFSDTLASEGPLTILAPNNDAFEALPPGLLDAVMASPPSLQGILSVHVLPGVALSENDLVDGASYETVLTGLALTIEVDEEGTSFFRFGEARFAVTEIIPLSNGSVIVIDGVIIPPRPR